MSESAKSFQLACSPFIGGNERKGQMLKLLSVLIFCFFLPAPSHAQDAKGQTCNQEGCSECLPLYPDGFKYEVAYKNGKIDGLQKIYYSNGKLAQELNYKNGKVDGPAKMYYPDGKLWEEQVYKEGALLDEKQNPQNGVYKRFYKNGQLANETQFKDGFRQGESKSYYEDGRIKVIENYINQDEWLLKTFDKQGKQIKDGRVNHQLFTGTHRIYNDKGGLEWEYSYEKSLPSGTMKHFGRNGNVDNEYLLKDGKATGDYKTFFESGQIQSKGKYDGTVLDGKYEEFYENGQLKYEANYQNGKRDGKAVGYYEDGKTQFEMFFKKEMPVGDRKDYSENGALKAGYKYLNGFKKWEYTTFYDNTKIQSVGIYTGEKDFKKDGLYKEFYKTGQLKFEAVYKDDKLIGNPKLYSPGGGRQK